MNRPAFAPRPGQGRAAPPPREAAREDVQLLVTLPRPASQHQPRARELRVGLKSINGCAPFLSIALFEIGKDGATWWPVRRWDEGRGVVTDAVALRRAELRAVHEAIGRALAQLEGDSAADGSERR